MKRNDVLKLILILLALIVWWRIIPEPKHWDDMTIMELIRSERRILLR